MSHYKTLALDQAGRPDLDELADAIDLASDQDQPTWVVDVNGGRVAAIVPVEVLEQHDAWIASTLRPSFSTSARGGVTE